MPTLTYTGPAGVRRIHGATFTRGVPRTVADRTANRILEGPHHTEFTLTPDPDPGRDRVVPGGETKTQEDVE